MVAWNLFSHLLNLDGTVDLFWSTKYVRNDSVPFQSLASRGIIHFLVLGIFLPHLEQAQQSLLHAEMPCETEAIFLG